MNWVVIFWFLIVSMPFCWAKEEISSNLDRPLIEWLRADRCLSTGMPYSFRILGIRRNAYMKIGEQFSATGIIERTIVDQGISIYDAALWQIVLSSTGDSQDLAMARQPIEYYWDGSLNEFSDIRTGSDNQIFVYDPNRPQAVSSDLSKKGYRGFIFRILNATGEYLSLDPVDGKTNFKDFPNDPRIHWEDWKPIAGENAWVVIAAMQLMEHRHRESWMSSVEFKLAQELAQAAIYLQADNGGIRMAPLGTYYHLLNINLNVSDGMIAQALDERVRKFRSEFSVPSKDLERLGGIDYPPYHTWYYEEISTENNLSWYAAFRMLYQVTGEARYSNAMKRIEGYLKSVWDPDQKLFYQGVHFSKGRWIPNNRYFAVDVQCWSLVVLGPKKIDEWFGEGASYTIWRTTKSFSGMYGRNSLAGVGFTKEKDRLSIEWTAGAILAVRKIAVYYALTHPEWSLEAKSDALNMRMGVDDYCFSVRPGQAAYSYSSVRRWIPFGWFSHNRQVLSLASTAWIVLIDKNINPFEL